MQFEAPSMGGGGGRDGRNAGRGAPPVKAEKATLTPGDRRSGDTAPPPLENVPEVYREAVKRYFTPREPDPAPK
jgi:hypothetical protein